MKYKTKKTLTLALLPESVSFQENDSAGQDQGHPKSLPPTIRPSSPANRTLQNRELAMNDHSHNKDATPRVLALIRTLNLAYSDSEGGQGYGVSCHWLTADERLGRLRQALAEVEAIYSDHSLCTLPYVKFLCHTADELRRKIDRLCQQTRPSPSPAALSRES